MKRKLSKGFQYLCVLSVMIMGFNQALITLVFEETYQLLDLMTVGTGFFVLLIGLANLIQVNSKNKELLILTIISNVIGLGFTVLLNASIPGISSYAAVLPFSFLLLFNFYDSHTDPKK